MLIIYGLLVLMVVIWSFSFVLVDITVELFMPAMSLALTRFLIASLVFIIVDIYFFINRKIRTNKIEERKEKVFYSKREWIYIIIASFCGTTLFFVIQYTAIGLIGPTLPALFVCLLSPVLITVLALIFFKEKLTSVKLIGFIIATIGGFLLVTGGDLGTLTPKAPNFIGYLYALITPLLWAIYTIATKKISKEKSNLITLKYIAYFGTVELFVFVLLNNELLIFIQNLTKIFVLITGLYLGIGCYIIGYFIWQKSQKELKSSKGASFLYIEPFLTLIFSTLLNRPETILIWNLVGGFIVLAAVLIINYN
ncbi:MAG: DMT family transporter [Candidatus Lokiarchaeota archaeon]|nr:DMT family transporter [Candidatus Lokiarchaeota archaeon]